MFRGDSPASVFPKKYVTGLSREACIGKWLDSIVSDAELILRKYYSPGTDYTTEGDKCEVGVCERYIRELGEKIRVLTPVLADMISPSLDNMDDFMVAQYGLGSDELYLYRRVQYFIEKYENDGHLDSDFMGVYAFQSMEPRLKEILFGDGPKAELPAE